MATRLHGRSVADIDRNNGNIDTDRTYEQTFQPGSAAFDHIASNRVATVAAGTGAGTTITIGSESAPAGGVFGLTAAFITAPVAADVTISGTVTFNIWESESSMSANAGARVIVYRRNHLGALSTIINSAQGTELGTSLAARNWTGSPTSTDLKRGDRLIFFYGFDDAGGTMASGFNLNVKFGGTVANSAESWVEFTETITFESVDANGVISVSGTLLYLTDNAAAVDPGSATEKALSASRDDGVVTATIDVTAGPHAAPGLQFTATAGGALIEWYSPQYQAFTFGGMVMVRYFETTGTPGPHRAVLYICDADGSNPVEWARSTALAYGLTSNSFFYELTGPNVSFGVGQRFLLRWYVDDVPGSPLVNGTDYLLSYGATSADVDGDTWVQFQQTLTEYTPTFALPIPRRDSGQHIVMVT